MRKIWYDWRIYLVVVTLFAIILRSIPAWMYSAWGNDFGIYYSITIEFLQKKNPFYEYPAIWGSSGYGSFPMLYLIILFFHAITGIAPNVLLLKIPPVIGGLCVVPLYFITYTLTRNRKLSLIASFLLAINPVHMYQTSMPYFLTIGHFFLLLSIYFFIKWQEEKKYFYYLVLTSLLLLLSHHLTTYMFIISSLGISFILQIYARNSKRKTKRNFLFVSLYSGVVFAYWLTRVKGMYSFLSSPFHHLIPWYGTIILFYVALYLLYLLSFHLKLTKLSKVRKWIGEIKISHIFSFSLAFSMVVFLLLALVGLRGYYIPFTAILYSIPFMLTIGFMGVGLSRMYKNSRMFYVVTGWLGAITLSMLFSVITWGSLEPWRHIEYMMEPLSIVGAWGVGEVLRSKMFKKVSIKKRVKVVLEAPIYIMSHRTSIDSPMPMETSVPVASGRQIREPMEYEEVYPIGRNMQIIFVSIFIFLLLMTGITAFPFMEQIEHPRKQGIPPVVMSGINWVVLNADKNYTVATDHLIGSVVEAYGFNSSFEYNYKLWNATSWEDCMWELMGLNGTYPPIKYIIISSSMYELGVYGYNESKNPLEPPVQMGKAGYEKFKKKPFDLVFKNSTPDNSDWVEVYMVDWNYIREQFNISNYQYFEIRSSKNSEKDYTPWYSHRDFLNFSISCSKEFSLSLFTSIPAIFIMKSRDFRWSSALNLQSSTFL